MIKKAGLIVLLAGVLLFAAACGGGKDACAPVPAESLTPEAAAAFAALDGEHGVMAYHDTAHSTRNQTILYVVLYGESGQEAELAADGNNLVVRISGEPGEGYAVWRMSYERKLMRQRQVSFEQGGAPQTLDGVETPGFVVEKEE